MSLDYSLLRTLHRLLKQQNDLKHRIKNGPKRIKLVEATESKFLAELEEAKQLVTDTKLAASQKELQLKSREAKIEELKAKRNSCESNKEYQLLNDQIAADEQANSVLSDEILEMLERVDQLEIEVTTAEANLDKAKAEAQRVRSKITDEVAELEKELERVTGERADTEKRLPTEIDVEYKRLVTGLGEDALSSTDMSTCGNCNQTLIPKKIDELLLNKAVFCGGCGSILYRADNAVSSQ